MDDYYMYNINLLLNEPINFHNICTIYPPTIKDILKFRIDEYSKLFIPLTASLDMFDIPEEDKANFKNFDLLFIQPKLNDFLMKAFEKPYLILLQETIKFFCRSETVISYEEERIYFGFNKTKYIDRNNYDEFSDLIFCFSTKEKPRKDDIPEFKSEQQKELWLKTMAGRQRNAQKFAINLESLINQVMYGGRSHINHEEILKMNIWMLNNAYKAILDVDIYYSNFKQYLAGAEPQKLDLTHWTQKLKIK
jgi:hypothetical protein